jgi:type I restriction enzyme, S subunit
VHFRFPGHEKVKMIDSNTEFGKIPEGWEIKKHKEVIENITLGGTPARKKEEYWENGTVPWVKSGKLNDLRIIDGTELITEIGVKESATKIMPKRTVLIAITGAILVSISEIELCANQSVVGLYGSSNLAQEYLYFYEKSIIDKYKGKMSGSAQQHINKEIINETDIIIPGADTMEEFEELIKPLFDEMSTLLFASQNLRQARDLLLPKLVTGEIEI